MSLNLKYLSGELIIVVGYGMIMGSMVLKNTELAIGGLGAIVVGSSIRKEGTIEDVSEEIESQLKQISNKLEKLTGYEFKKDNTQE